MSVVLPDTVGLIALWDVSDQWHERAKAAMALLDMPGMKFISTSYILLECGNAAARKPFRADVCLLRDGLEGQGNLMKPTEGEIEEAWANYRRDEIGGAGIVDHVSFAVMRRLAITDVFSNDRHFKAAGFNTLF